MIRTWGRNRDRTNPWLLVWSTGIGVILLKWEK